MEVLRWQAKESGLGAFEFRDPFCSKRERGGTGGTRRKVVESVGIKGRRIPVLITLQNLCKGHLGLTRR